MNDTQPPTTTYVSHVVPVPTDLALAAFASCRADRQFRSSRPDRWTLAAAPGELVVLDASGLGVLRAGTRRSRRIELELRPWSATSTELGVRFLSRRAVSQRAFDAAWAVLEVLAAEIELRALLARHPEHATGEDRHRLAASAWL